METMQNILTRRSVRKFADKPIEPDKLHTILEAAMSGPCAVNAREWAFIVVTDREKLAQMAEANGRVARMLNQAAAAILVCGDLDRAFPPAPDFWVIDAAIAAQNMTLAANDLGHRIGLAWHLAGRNAREAAGGNFPAAGDDCTALDPRARLSGGGYRHACSAPQPLRRKPRTR